jgi:hypothetical protein
VPLRDRTIFRVMGHVRARQVADLLGLRLDVRAGGCSRAATSGQVAGTGDACAAVRPRVPRLVPSVPPYIPGLPCIPVPPIPVPPCIPPRGGSGAALCPEAASRRGSARMHDRHPSPSGSPAPPAAGRGGVPRSGAPPVRAVRLGGTTCVKSAGTWTGDLGDHTGRTRASGSDGGRRPDPPDSRTAGARQTGGPGERRTAAARWGGEAARRPPDRESG